MTDIATSTYYLAEVPNSGLSIRLHLGVVERLQRELLDMPRRQGDEVGGILLGTVLDSSRSVVVEDYQTVTACLRKDRFYDSDQDRATLERVTTLWQPDPNSNIYAIGFFRSDSRANLKPEEGDRHALSSYLPQSDSVLLLIGANRDKAAAAALYFAEKGQLRRSSPSVRFPFDRSELVDKSAAQQHPDNGSARAALQIVGRPQEKRTRSSARRGFGLSLLRWVLITLVAAGLLAAALFEYRVANLLSNHVKVESRPSSALGLRTERNGSELLLSWDPAASAMAAAARGHLSIADGPSAKQLDLTADDLRGGRIAYAPITDDVTFRLEVVNAAPGKSVVESLRVLSGAPPVPVAALPNSVPPPTTQRVIPRAASSPARVSSLPVGPNHPSAAAPLPGGRASWQPQQVVEPPVEDFANDRLAGTTSPLNHPSVPAATRTAALSVASALPTPVAGIPAPPPVRVGGKAESAVAIHRTLPAYPTAAVLEHISGVVRVMATVTKDGTVKDVRVIDGPVVLREAAVTAVQQWRYKPALLNGSPVESTTAANVVFRLNN